MKIDPEAYTLQSKPALPGDTMRSRANYVVDVEDWMDSASRINELLLKTLCTVATCETP